MKAPSKQMEQRGSASETRETLRLTALTGKKNCPMHRRPRGVRLARAGERTVSGAWETPHEYVSRESFRFMERTEWLQSAGTAAIGATRGTLPVETPSILLLSSLHSRTEVALLILADPNKCCVETWKISAIRLCVLGL